MTGKDPSHRNISSFGGIAGGFIANGDRATVRRVRNVRELYGFRFADVTLSFPDYDNTEEDMVVILDTLKGGTGTNT